MFLSHIRSNDYFRSNQYPSSGKDYFLWARQEVRGPRKSLAFWGAFDCRGNNRSNECEIRTLSKLSSNKNIVDVVDNSNPCRGRDIDCRETLSPLSSINTPVGCRSAADVENQLTQFLFQTQDAHEEIILEVTDFRPGTEYGYNTPCPSSILEATSFSDDC